MIRPLRALAFLLPLFGLAAAAQAQTAPSPFTTGYRYDNARRLTGTSAPDPDGAGPLRHAAVRNSYDSGGRLTKVEKGELANWQSEAVEPKSWPDFTIHETAETAYDTMGRKTVEKAGVGSAVPTLAQTSYDAAGRVGCVALRMNPAAHGVLPDSACTLGAQGSDGPDRITHNVYDLAGQLLTVQRAYRITTANGFASTLQQDYAAYEYTPNGRRKAVTDANGNRAELRYDGHDRQSCWIFPSKTTPGALGGDCVTGDFESYGYDPNGNRRSLRKRDGRVIGYDYDALNRVTIKDVPEFGLDVRYTYDLRGLRTGAWFTGSGQGVWNDYDGFGRPLSSKTTMGGTARTLNYNHDSDGRRTHLTHPDGMLFGFGYDGLGRMNAVAEPGDRRRPPLQFRGPPRDRGGSKAKGVPDREIGPSGIRKVHIREHSTVKRAKDMAQSRSARGQAPVKHRNPKRGDPHLHAVNAKGKQKSHGVHEVYPRRGYPRKERE